MSFYERINEITKSKGGNIISEYKSLRKRDNIILKCIDGHIWKAMCQNIVYNNTWCPYCKKSKGEIITRFILEKLCNCIFPSSRPKWLKTDKGVMELDGYNENLKLAFEFNGEQHYIYSKNWHKTQEKFEYRKYKDKLKIKLCKLYGVKLLIIPYYIKHDDIHEYIKSILPFPTLDVKINLNEALLESSILKEIQDHIFKKWQGVMISKVYMGIDNKMKFKCNNNHIFNQSWGNIKKGHFCKKCTWNDVIEQSRINLHLFLNKHNLILLGKYHNSHTNTDWKCKICNNIFTSSKSHINRKLGCENHTIKKNRLQKSLIRRVTMKEKLKLFLKDNNLELLDEYKGTNIKNNWKCIICNKTFFIDKHHIKRKLGCENH